MPVKKPVQIFGEVLSRKTTAGVYSYLVRVADKSGVSFQWLKPFELPIEKIVRYETELNRNLSSARKNRLERRNNLKTQQNRYIEPFVLK